MRMIEGVYDKYFIMPQLREHMYRVAAVSKIICDNLSFTVDKKSIINACLLHDMGNIIKFDLNQFPEWNAPKGIEYWQGVKDKFVDTYGNDTHKASVSICMELGASLRVLELVNSIGFRKAVEVSNSGDIEKMICLYSDMRVSPTGIVSLAGRLEDFSKRYKNKDGALVGKEVEDVHLAMYSIEEKIFQNLKINPSDISDQSCKEIMDSLKNFTF